MATKTHIEEFLAIMNDLGVIKYGPNTPMSSRIKQLRELLLRTMTHFSSPLGEKVPEVPEYREAYDGTITKTTVNSRPIVWTVDWVNIYQTREQAVVDYLAVHFAISDERPSFYIICKEFGEHLAAVKLDIKCQFVPEYTGCIYIQFPEGVRFKHQDGTYARCAYVHQNPGGEGDVRNLRIVMPDYDESGKTVGSFTWLHFPLETHETVEEAALSINAGSALDVLMYILKCYIYVFSGEPDLRSLKAPSTPKTDNPKKLRSFLRKNQGSLLDVVMVGFDFKKGRAYSKDSTQVTGHFRPYRCGPGKQFVKLLWVDEHTRHYHSKENK